MHEFYGYVTLAGLNYSQKCRNAYLAHCCAEHLYNIGLLKETKVLPEFVEDDLLSNCEAIRQALEPIMEEYRGEYYDMPDDEFYDWLNEVFGDGEEQDEDFDL